MEPREDCEQGSAKLSTIRSLATNARYARELAMIDIVSDCVKLYKEGERLCDQGGVLITLRRFGKPVNRYPTTSNHHDQQPA